MSKPSTKIDLKEVFGAAVTLTFALEIISILIIIGSIVPHVISVTGILAGITFDILLFLAFIAGGIALMIIIVFASAFIRGDRKLQDKILTAQFRHLSKVASEAKALLFMFGIAVLLFCFAGFYGYYLLWKYVFSSFIDGQAFLLAIFLAIGMIIVSLLAQIVLAAIGRFAVRAEKLTRR